jgi:hypothetical protein
MGIYLGGEHCILKDELLLCWFQLQGGEKYCKKCKSFKNIQLSQATVFDLVY